MIIDSHAHVALEQVLPLQFFDGWADNLQRLLPPDAPASQRTALVRLLRQLNQDHGCDQLVAEMDRAGIAKTVLLIVDFGFAYPQQMNRLEEIYELHRAIVARHPGRFIVFAGVDPRRGGKGRQLLERALRDGDVRGFKIYPPCGYSPEQKDLYPFYEICAKYKAPVLTHIGPTSPTLSFKHTHPNDIENAAFLFPEVNFILGHAGVVWRDDAALLAAYRPNVYLDLSGFQPAWRKGHLDQILTAHKSAGVLRKLLFGTDWPIHRMHGSQLQAVDALRDCARRAIITEEELDWIFYRNAAQLLREPAGPAGK
jgi:predicted TIM-barrel fold metal-dependent hydrolase